MSVSFRVFLAMFLLQLPVAFAAEKEAETKKFPVAKKDYSYIVKVSDYSGAAGYGLHYYVSESSVVIVQWNDYDKPSIEVLNKTLTDSQRKEWIRFLKSFRVDQFKKSYDNPKVFDGLDRTFTFNVKGKKIEVKVRNRRVRGLVRLCSKINKFVPKKFQLNW